MIPSEARDLMFAGAGILWGIVTLFRGMREWHKRRHFMKHLIVIMLGVLLFGPMGWADESKPAEDVSSYLETLQVKLDHAAQRANQPSDAGSSVVGLRGSKQEPLSKQLYWKGKSGNTPVSTDEVKMFRSAVESARGGKTEEARASLKSFIEKYPTGSLKGDAEETLQRLSASKP